MQILILILLAVSLASSFLIPSSVLVYMKSEFERAKRRIESYSGIEANLVEQVAALSQWGRKRRDIGEFTRSKRQAPSFYYYGLRGNVIGAYTPLGLAFNPLRVAPLTNWGRK